MNSFHPVGGENFSRLEELYRSRPEQLYQLDRSIVMVGLMGAGKTKIGRWISRQTGAEFVDSDREIESESGRQISDIFDLEGEAEFRALERRKIRCLLSKPKMVVLSVGGGAFCQADSRQMIKEKAISVWLRAPPETLAARISNLDTRPLLKDKDPVKVLRELAKQREASYAEADVVVDTDGLDLSQSENKVFATINHHLKASTKQREASYAEADVVVDTDGLDLSQSKNKVLATINHHLMASSKEKSKEKRIEPTFIRRAV